MQNVRLIAGWLLLCAMLAAPAVLVAQSLENLVAVCGCGKVFTVSASTQYLTVGGKQYACCSKTCHEMAMKDPAAAVAKWTAAESQVLAGRKSREQIYKEIEEMFGLVPSMFKAVPDESLQMEWELFKQVQMAPGAIPNKYRELLGIAVAAATKCQYCIYYHTEVAKLNGATQAEIEDALHYAKSSAGWSTYINGLQIGLEQFKREIDQACQYVKSQQTKTTAAQH